MANINNRFDEKKPKTFESFKSEAESAGLYNTFSDKDIEIAKNNADYGYKLLGLKQEYNATTDENKRQALAEQANYERMNHGYYNTVEGNGNEGGYKATAHTIESDARGGQSDTSKKALNNIGDRKQKVIVILNDNGMSISPNIGGLSAHLGNLRTSKIREILSNFCYKRNLRIL